jgi:predicted P-loop ATPase
MKTEPPDPREETAAPDPEKIPESVRQQRTKELSKLPLVEYELIRNGEATALGMRRAALDAAVALLRRAQERSGNGKDSAPRTGPAWLEQLARHKDHIVGDERNTLRAFHLAPELAGLIRFNEFSLRVELTRAPPWHKAEESCEWGDDDDVSAIAWLQTQGFPLRKQQIITNIVPVVAKELSYHPVRDYLTALKWDGTKRLDTWLATYLGATGKEQYLTAIGRRFLISAVARISDPGCQVDHVLVTESSQGPGKSSAARKLACQDDWFTDAMPDVHSKDAALQLSGHWIIELAELAALRRTEIEPMKSFITRRVDNFRPPYGRHNISAPRQCVFIAPRPTRSNTCVTQQATDASGRCAAVK